MAALITLLKRWDWALYGLIFLYLTLPQFYRSYSIYLESTQKLYLIDNAMERD